VTPTPLPVTATPAATSGEVWISTSDGLFLRQQATKDSPSVIATPLPIETHLTTIGPTVGPDALGIVWQQVKTDDGTLGWVAVKVNGEATVTTSKP
jgi:hypothetical protein